MQVQQHDQPDQDRHYSVEAMFWSPHLPNTVVMCGLEDEGTLGLGDHLGLGHYPPVEVRCHIARVACCRHPWLEAL